MVNTNQSGLNPFTACSIVENFFDEDYEREDIIAAWQYLIDTGLCWELQGSYGRQAAELIRAGVCEAKRVKTG
jgi:hypothetical protein